MGWLEALADWPVAEALRASFYAYPLVNVAHILGFILLVGGIAPVDLRLLGAWRSIPLTAFARVLEPMAAVGLVLAVGAGFLLFSVKPEEYAANTPFLIKVGLVAAGTANALVQRFSAGWKEAVRGGPVPAAVKARAVLSLAIWLGALTAGRFIAFLD
ncbi:MAG: DUF2214 domain-containing protein [Bauldia sp.]|nr:DUF2214 domain-containing protein [Bauldia sp.]